MAYSTSTDSGFFVESDEPRQPKMSMKDAAKMLARNRQEMIANDLSRLAGDEYLEDIMQHMRHMEVGNLSLLACCWPAGFRFSELVA